MVKARSVTHKVWSKYLFFKHRLQMSKPQLTENLLKKIRDLFKPPFSITGGPLPIKKYKQKITNINKQIKRYRLSFTCLTVRGL